MWGCHLLPPELADAEPLPGPLQSPPCREQDTAASDSTCRADVSGVQDTGAALLKGPSTVRVRQLDKRLEDANRERDAWRDQAQRILLALPVAPERTVTETKTWRRWPWGRRER